MANEPGRELIAKWRDAECTHSQADISHCLAICDACAELHNCANELEAALAARSSSETGARYVIVADGEGAQARVISGDNVHESLHNFMCCCRQTWDKCETGDITTDIRLIDDDDSWIFDEDHKRFSCSWPHETGKITLYVLAREDRQS